ncbi:Tbc1 Domain Family Member 30 [Manis pentadactyla]|nr:Tbc1 Domain Family Member 30 [Manis pentadactyla]
MVRVSFLLIVRLLPFRKMLTVHVRTQQSPATSVLPSRTDKAPKDACRRSLTVFSPEDKPTHTDVSGCVCISRIRTSLLYKK